MLPKVILFYSMFFVVSAMDGTDCSFGTSENLLSKIANTCPRPFQSADKTYCCLDIQRESFYCCNFEEFTLKTGLGIIIPAIIAVVVVVSVIVFCISCLCCSCCPWYRRRHRGTIYGKVGTPAVVTVVHPASMQPFPQSQTPNITAPAVQAVSSLPAQPPPYTPEAYAKQAPYNPNYQQ